MLRFPRALWIALALGFLVSSPALFGSLALDDQFMVLRMEGAFPAPDRGPFGVYEFASGAPYDHLRVPDGCISPWWVAQGARAVFFRPLASALLWLEHSLTGRDPLPYHLDSIAWYLAVVALASRLLRRLLPGREAALATLLFAVAPVHYMIAAWPASRHLSISAAFGLVALLLHLRAREDGADRAWTEPLALGSTAVALLGGESALAVFAFVFAYEWLGREEPVAGRVRALVPWGALLLAYAALYRARSYGVSDSAAYLDPTRYPFDYLRELPTRFFTLAEASLLGASSELTNFLPPRVTTVFALAGAGAVVAIGLLLRRALRTCEPGERRNLGWLIAGALLAVLPGAAGFPGDRILLLPSVATAAILAVVLLRARTPSGETPEAPLAVRLGVGFFALVHVVLAPVAFFGNVSAGVHLTSVGLDIARGAELPSRPGVRVVAIALSDPYVGFYLPSQIWFAPHAAPLPQTVQLLSMARHDHLVKRTDERTLEIDVLDGTLFETRFERLGRAPGTAFAPGDVVALGTWTVRILETVEGRPARFSVTFDASVDDPSIGLVSWRDGAIRALPAPAIGQEVLVRREPGPMRL